MDLPTEHRAGKAPATAALHAAPEAQAEAVQRVLYDMRLLPSFVVLADELHFGRAAARLLYAQPALSQQIRRLETQIGVALFVRSSRAVELTAAGAAFREHAERSLAAAQDAGVAVRASDHAGSGTLQLILAGSSLPYVKRLLRQFAASHEDVAVDVGTQFPCTAVAALEQGNADAVVLPSGKGPPPGFEDRSVLIADPGLGITAHASHPLADAAVLDVAALRGQRLLMFPRDVSPELHDRAMSCLGGAGNFRAVEDLETFGPDLQQELAFAFGEDSITLSTAWTADHHKPDGTVFIPLQHPIPFSLWLVWGSEPSAAARALAELARRAPAASVLQLVAD